MTLLTVVQDVCATVGVAVPNSVFTNINANRTMVEFLALATECAQRIAYNNRDWSRLRKTVTLTGDGTTTAFNLPADYQRMLLTSNVWRSSQTLMPMQFIADTDEWMNRRTRNIIDTYGEWMLMGGKIHIAPTLAASETAYFTYLDKNCISLVSGGTGDRFANDNDTFLLDERVFRLCMTWTWKSEKGTAYGEDIATYGDALAFAQKNDGPSPILIGRSPISSSRVAYPWPVPS